MSSSTFVSQYSDCSGDEAEPESTQDEDFPGPRTPDGLPAEEQVSSASHPSAESATEESGIGVPEGATAAEPDEHDEEVSSASVPAAPATPAAEEEVACCGDTYSSGSDLSGPDGSVDDGDAAGMESAETEIIGDPDADTVEVADVDHDTGLLRSQARMLQEIMRRFGSQGASGSHNSPPTTSSSSSSDIENQFPQGPKSARLHPDYLSDESEEEAPRPATGGQAPAAGTSGESVDSEEDSSSSADNGGSENTSDDEDGDGEDGRRSRAAGGIVYENPFSGRDNEVSTSTGESVFAVPLRADDKHQSSLLERHVKLTPAHRQQSKINGKKICWSYRKGKCRFGHKCTYAHDSDIPQEDGAGPSTTNVTVPSPSQSNPELPSSSTSGPPFYPTSNGAGDPNGEGHGGGLDRPRKRPGLSQSIVPGKKVMAHYRKVGDQAGPR